MVLSVSGFSVAAGGKTLFSGVSFRLDPGETMAVCGPSGSGKTSLLRAISGLDDPEAGEVHLVGLTPEQHGWPVFRRRVLHVDQRPVLTGGTVEGNLRLPWSYRTSDNRPFPMDEAALLLEAFGISSERLVQKAETLSVGQKQRVCLARAFLLKPDVLLLDEPTSSLDPEAVASVEEALGRETKRRGLAAIIVTHDSAQAERLCSRVLDLTEYGATADVS